MKKRMNYGTKNNVGANIERLRLEKGIKQKDMISKIQTEGIDINPSSYSKLEGQTRVAKDNEFFVIAKILGVEMKDLYSW